MSAITDTKKAAERRLATLNYPTSYEGVSFTAPDTYLQTQFQIGTPEDPVIGDKYYRERITFQVFVTDLVNIGTANAYSKAQEIRQLFDKGLTLIEGATRIYVLGTPQVSGSIVTNDRLIVPVLIDLIAEVYT
jgi:Bacteriophage related domain of unknown function